MNTYSIRNHTDCYFTKSLESAVNANVNPLCVWQVFQKKDSIFAGLGMIQDRKLLLGAKEVWSLADGDSVSPFEPAMIIKGYFQDLVEEETVYLGIIARCTLVATNVRRAVTAANGKPVLFFPARFDVPEVQVYDGFAAGIGGAAGCATAMQTDGFAYAHPNSSKVFLPVGTMPHALIAAFGGDTAAASLAFAAARPNEDVWALVDFSNDCARTSVEVFRAMQDKGIGHRLAGVRLDTSEKLIDKSLPQVDEAEYRGVNPYLVHAVRQALNEAGAQHVKIGVSGGFSPEKIALFEKNGVPADVYAIGESFIRGSNAYTSDIVARFEGNRMVPCGKIGRELRPNLRLKLVHGSVYAVGK